MRRVLLGLEAVGVQRAVVMPDLSHLCRRARDDAQISIELDVLDMPVFSSVDDSVRAATAMDRIGVGCLVTLGGDGTNRSVAKGCGSVPLVPISTGTNNVFPTMVEGTLAGMAAGIAALGLVDRDLITVNSKRIEVYLDGEFRDLALVDLAVSKERFVAARAIWDMSTIHEVYLTRAEPTSIGLSSIGSRLHAISMTDKAGLYYCPGPGETTVLAPVAPGMVSEVSIQEWRVLSLDERVEIDHAPCTIALDGERDFAVLPGQRVEVAVSDKGPRVVMPEVALTEATRRGVFTTNGR